MSIIAGYRYEHYDQDDWQFDGLGVTRLTSNVTNSRYRHEQRVFLRNGLEDFEAHLFSISFVIEL